MRSLQEHERAWQAPLTYADAAGAEPDAAIGPNFSTCALPAGGRRRCFAAGRALWARPDRAAPLQSSNVNDTAGTASRAKPEFAFTARRQ